MAFTKACDLGDIRIGSMKEFYLDGKDLLVAKASNGSVCAVQAMCPHQDIPLVEGRFDGKILTCRAHPWKFDVLTGKGISPQGCAIATYPVECRDDGIYVDPDAAEPFASNR